MEFPLLIVFGLLVGTIILAFSRRLNFLCTVHLFQFWFITIGYELYVMYVNGTQYDLGIFVYVLFCLLLYVILFGIGAKFLKQSLNYNQFVNSCLAVNPRTIASPLWAWLAFKIYLLLRYGTNSFQLVALWREIDALYIEVAIQTFLTYAAIGAVGIMLIRWGYWGFKEVKRGGLLLPAGGFLVFFLTTGEAYMGARRFFVGLVVVITAASLHGIRFRFRLLTYVLIMAFMGTVPIFGDFSQSVRANFNDPNVSAAFDDGNIIEAFRLLLTPSTNYSSLQEYVFDRTGQVPVLYQISLDQWTDFRWTHGQMILQALENSVPSLLLPTKRYINADQILAQTYNLPPIDLPAGVLSILQSEFFILGYLIAPLLYFLVFKFGTAVLLRSRHGLAVCATCGVLLLTAITVEDTLEAITLSLRDIALIWVLFVIITNALSLFNRYRNPRYPSLTHRF